MKKKTLPLIEVLVKTTYQIVISKERSFQSEPIAYGSGFFINYKHNLFFITADHNIHIKDHKQQERTGIDNYCAILNNINDINTCSTIMTPIGNFYYMEKFYIKKEVANYELVDIAVSLVDKNQLKYPFLTDENIRNEDILIVSPKEPKLEFLEKCIIKPKESDTYYVFGKIKFNFEGGFLYTTSTFKNDLKYIRNAKDYILLNSQETIIISEWAGLSGSPVLNQEGKCLGILCSVIDNTKSIFVKPFSKILPFLDCLISLQEIKKLALLNFL